MMRLPSLRWLLTMLCGMVGLSIIMWVWLSVTYVEHVFIQDTAGAEPDGIVINVGKINAPVPLGGGISVGDFGDGRVGGLQGARVKALVVGGRRGGVRGHVLWDGCHPYNHPAVLG